MNSSHQQGGGGGGADGYSRPMFSQLAESDEYDHLRRSVEAKIPLDDAEAWSDFAGRNFDIAVPSDEELERDIMKGYVEDSMNTPICDFRSLMQRMQNQISENHKLRIMEGKESFGKINDSIIEQFSNEDIAVTHNDLNDLLKKLEPYSMPYLIDVDKIVDKFNRGESFGTLQDNTKRQRQKAEDHDPSATLQRKSASGDKLENALEIEMYDDQDDYTRGQKAFVTSNKRPASNPPQLSASMLAAAAKRRLKEVDFGEIESTPTIVISSVKSLAPQEASASISIASSQTGSRVKGLIPILPKPLSKAQTVTSSTSTSTSTIHQAASSTSVSPQQVQRPVLLAYIDDGGGLRLINPGSTVTSLGSGPQAPYKLLLRSPSGGSNILTNTVRPTGISQLSQFSQLQTRPGTGRPLILTSHGGSMRPIGIRNLTTISSGSRHILNSKLLPAKLVTQGSQSQGISNKKLPEVPLQATPFRVNFESNDELSDLGEKFSSTESGNTPAFSRNTSKSSSSAVKDNSDKIIGF